MRLALFGIVVLGICGCGGTTTPPPKAAPVTPTVETKPASASQAKQPDVETAYFDPVGNQTLVAPGGWRRYEPDNPKPRDPNEKVRVDQVRLITPEMEIFARTTVDDLAAFIKEAERLSKAPLGKSKTGFQLVLQLSCRPDGFEPRIACMGEAPLEVIEEYYQALFAMKKLAVTEGEVKIHIEMTVRAD
jgi:hypothetical protein